MGVTATKMKMMVNWAFFSSAQIDDHSGCEFVPQPLYLCYPGTHRGRCSNTIKCCGLYIRKSGKKFDPPKKCQQKMQNGQKSLFGVHFGFLRRLFGRLVCIEKWSWNFDSGTKRCHFSHFDSQTRRLFSLVRFYLIPFRDALLGQSTCSL